jgi:chromate transporter
VLLELFSTFFKIGLFTFGGGYAMIPLIEKEVLERKAWISQDELMEIIAISQMTPGPIATNAATFVGKKMGGKRGSVAATIGVVLPSLIIITLISLFFSKNFDNIYVQKIFMGMRAGITASIFLSVKKLSKAGAKDKMSFGIFLFSLVALMTSFISPFILIGMFGIGSIGLYMAMEAKKK